MLHVIQMLERRTGRRLAGRAVLYSALAIALGASARTVQRALEQLAATGKVQPVGRGRARRWLTPTPGAFSTLLLLPGPLPGD